MRVMGQRVSRTAGGTIGVGRGLVRFVVLTLGFLPLLVSAVLILFDDRRRGLHDLAAGTVVASG
jgi:uncharacterized RDD family membrane protein YckC